MKGLFAFALSAIRRVWTSTVGWSFAVVALRAGGFLLVLPIALRVLTPGEMGLWYLFVSISDLCMAVEMGLANSIGRAASYFVGGAPAIMRDGLPTGQAPTLSRPPNVAGLAGLLALSRRVYGWIALGVVLAMGVGGVVLVAPKVSSLGDSSWPYLLAFGVHALATALAIFGLYWPNFLSGIGHMRLSQRTLLAALVLNYATSAACLLLGLGPLSLALGQLVLAAVTFGLARRYTRRVCPDLRATTPQLVALGDLWPSTWRAMLTATGGYFCSYGMLFVCGVLADLATTASFGLSFRFGALVHGIAAIWLQARIPGIATARAAGQFQTALQLTATALPRCITTLLVGCIALYSAGPVALELIGSRTPLLAPPLLAAMLLLFVLDFLVGFHAAVLQTANRFPHLPVMVASGAGAMIIAFTLGHWNGVAGILVAPMLAQVVCAYWWVPLRCWRDLLASAHAAPENQESHSAA